MDERGEESERLDYSSPTASGAGAAAAGEEEDTAGGAEEQAAGAEGEEQVCDSFSHPATARSAATRTT